MDIQIRIERKEKEEEEREMLTLYLALSRHLIFARQGVWLLGLLGRRAGPTLGFWWLVPWCLTWLN